MGTGKCGKPHQANKRGDPALASGRIATEVTQSRVVCVVIVVTRARFWVAAGTHDLEPGQVKSASDHRARLRIAHSANGLVF